MAHSNHELTIRAEEHAIGVFSGQSLWLYKDRNPHIKTQHLD